MGDVICQCDLVEGMHGYLDHPPGPEGRAATIGAYLAADGAPGGAGALGEVLANRVADFLYELTDDAVEAALAPLRAKLAAVEALVVAAEAGEGIVIYPGHREYHLVETGLLRAALSAEQQP